MKKTLFFLLLLTSPTFATANDELPHASLFFTPAETHQAEILAMREAPQQGNIHLGAVMYYGPQDWTIWLQGAKWTPETTRGDIHILQVSPNDVRLSWHDEEKGADQIITLRPNESFQIATGKIIPAP